jgi:hypothetical protein
MKEREIYYKYRQAYLEYSHTSELETLLKHLSKYAKNTHILLDSGETMRAIPYLKQELEKRKSE